MTVCIGRQKTTPVGFEPTRGDPIGLADLRLSRSAKVSLQTPQLVSMGLRERSLVGWHLSACTLKLSCDVAAT